MNFINKILMTLSVVGLITTGTEQHPDHATKLANMKLNAGIITSKLKESKFFYQQVLNFSVKFENEWFVLLDAPGGTSQLSFLEPGHESQQTIFQTAFGGKGVYFTMEVEDVDAEYHRIKALNIPIRVDLRSENWGDRHFVIVDPNDIGIDIVKHTAPE